MNFVKIMKKISKLTLAFISRAVIIAMVSLKLRRCLSMAKCAICDKSRQTGHRISINRSQVSRRANKTWNANVKKLRLLKRYSKSINVCTRCLRSGKVTRLSSVKGM